MYRNTEQIQGRLNRNKKDYDDEAQAHILILKEITLSLEGLYSIEGFTKAELMEMYNHIAVV